VTQSGSNIGLYVSCDELRGFVSKGLSGGVKQPSLASLMSAHCMFEGEIKMHKCGEKRKFFFF
jgi:uncharacterized protein YgfB (UPF0149 family)